LTKEELRYPGGLPLSSGDRIFVLKYLDGIFEPRRFDVVVFKDPSDPQTNFIKRLVGLPGEQVALVDGDVFFRPAQSAASPDAMSWASTDWKIARKPRRAQDTVWQTVFSSQFTPQNAMRDGNRWFTSPWIGEGASWKIEDRADYQYLGDAPTSLRWDSSPDATLDFTRHQSEPGFRRFHLADFYPYNEPPQNFVRSGGFNMQPAQQIFPVSDLRVSMGIEPARSGLRPTFHLAARGHEFRARLVPQDTTISMDRWVLEMRPAAEGEQWRTLAESAERADWLREGATTNIEFEHVDQSLRLLVEGNVVAEGFYDWTPAQRIEHTLGKPYSEIATAEAARFTGEIDSRGRPVHRPECGFSVFASGDRYRKPQVRIDFEGGAFTLHRVAIARDLHYQAAAVGEPRDRTFGTAFATSPMLMPSLTADEFFMCGDNSPASSDGRLWAYVDPWVASKLDSKVGVVHRKLVVGKAFYVYFPSMPRTSRWPMMDFGRMRWIW
jgi:signal peptidase I